MTIIKGKEEYLRCMYHDADTFDPRRGKNIKEPMFACGVWTVDANPVEDFNFFEDKDMRIVDVLVDDIAIPGDGDFTLKPTTDLQCDLVEAKQLGGRIEGIDYFNLDCRKA